MEILSQVKDLVLLAAQHGAEGAGEALKHAEELGPQKFVTVG